MVSSLATFGEGGRQWFGPRILRPDAGMPQFVLVNTEPNDSLKTKVAPTATVTALFRIHMGPDRHATPLTRVCCVEEGILAFLTKPQAIRLKNRIERR